MFHPDPEAIRLDSSSTWQTAVTEAHKIRQQLHLANSHYMMVSKKKWSVMNKFTTVSPKVDGSLRSFTTLVENTDAQYDDSKSKRHGSSQYHVAGVPQQACICAVIKRSFGVDRRDGSKCHQS